MGKTTAEAAALPEGPDIKRRPLFYSYHLTVVTLLFLAVVLAIAGVFGTTEVTEEVRGEGVSVRATYLKRTRLGVDSQATIDVRNETELPLEGMVLLLPKQYLDGFEGINI